MGFDLFMILYMGFMLALVGGVLLSPLIIGLWHFRRQQYSVAARVQTLALVVLLAPIAYLGSAFLVFDTSSRGQSFHEGYRDGRRVAFGPRPRTPFTYGGKLDSPDGWIFHGDEPLWKFYAPVCAVWRAQNGYAKPSVWMPR